MLLYCKKKTQCSYYRANGFLGTMSMEFIYRYSNMHTYVCSLAYLTFIISLQDHSEIFQGSLLVGQLDVVFIYNTEVWNTTYPPLCQ